MAPTRGEISFDLYITVNSPGEIAGWAAPVVREVRSRVHNARITLVIVPCQYASGHEQEIAAASGADRIVRIGELSAMKHSDAESGPALRKGGRVLTLHLGGDMLWSVYMSRRLKSELWAYCSRPRWGRSVSRYFVPDERAERSFAILNFPASRYMRVGHLALDSVELKEDEAETRAFLRISPDDEVVAFLTGSRPIEYLSAVPYFAKVASRLLERFPAVKFFFPLASFVDDEMLRRSLVESGVEWMGESLVRAVKIGEGDDGPVWAPLVRDRTLEILNCASFAIAVPGTSNLQAAALYTPYMMVLPLDRADEFPLDGLMGVLPLWLPGMRRLKRHVITKLNERTELVSLPNKIAGRMIAPEMRGIFPIDAVVRYAAELIADKERLQQMSRAFFDLTHERGAAAKIATEIAAFAKG